MGFISSLAMFAPIILIIALKLSSYKTYPILLLYFTLELISNLLYQHFIILDMDQQQNFGIIINLLDIPLMLYFLTYFSPSKDFTKKIRILILAYVVFEMLVLGISGFNGNSIAIILGPGILFVLLLSLHFFSRQVKMAVIHNKAKGKALMATGIVFAYGSFSFLYLMYYIFKAHLDDTGKIVEQYQQDTFLLYYIATTISSVVFCIGLVLESKRVKKLNELKQTRKELAEIYPETRNVTSFRTPMLDFDKDAWN